MACTIGIGRKVGTGELLTDNRWEWFKCEVRGTLKGLDATIIAECEGSGEWEGVSEPCACFVFELDVTDEAGWTVLRAMLADTARRYGQEAIALTIGKTEFIGRA